MQVGDDPGSPDPSFDLVDAERLKPLGNELGGFEFLKTELGMLMEIAPVGDHPRHDFVNVVVKIDKHGHGATRSLLVLHNRFGLAGIMPDPSRPGIGR